MGEEELKLDDDKLFVYTPLSPYGDEICKGIYKVHLVMTKEIFRECYKKWVEPQEKTDMLDKIRADIFKNSSYGGFELGSFKDGYTSAMARVLKIIDNYKYKLESNPQERSCEE